MKRNDIILLLILLVVSVLSFSLYSALSVDGDIVKITVNGRLYDSFPINKDKTLTISQNNEHINILKIESNTISMIEASCTNQTCCEHHPISKIGEIIVCLPNRVLVEITNSKETISLDGISY